MAEIVKYNARVQQKIDTSANWDINSDFIPLEGEIIVYSDLNLIKIGNGKTTIGELPFSFESITADEIDSICGTNFTQALETIATEEVGF